MEVNSFGKYLASSDKQIRDKAIKSVTSFLSNESNQNLSDLEMAKLWKGIFYCFWMSDKPLIQQALATELSEIMLSIPSLHAALNFLRGFWQALVREWSGLDRLRLDKYYMLVRRFICATFRLLRAHQWDGEACNEYNGIISGSGGPLNPDDIKAPSSLAYHLADVYLEELDKSLSYPSIPPAPPTQTPIPLLTLLTPFLSLLARTQSNTTFSRIQSSLLSPLLSSLLPSPPHSPRPKKKPRLSSSATSNASTERSLENLVNSLRGGAGEDEGEGEGEMYKNVLRRVFDVASRDDCREANRKKMYALWREGMEVVSEGAGVGEGEEGS